VINIKNPYLFFAKTPTIATMKITLRKHPLVNNRSRLYLDYYPPLKDPQTGKPKSYENLKLYLYNEPQTPAERLHNKETSLLAENIRARRQLDIQAQLHGFMPNHFRLQSFNAYFRQLADKQRGGVKHNWDSSVRYFEQFARRDLRFADINVAVAEDFKRYLRSGPKIRQARAGIRHNSALAYFNKFRNSLKQAWKEKLIPDDLSVWVEGLREEEVLVEFLDMNDLQRLIQTPLEPDLCRRVVLVGVITGLRFCDLKDLRWGQVRGVRGQFYLQFQQRKTHKPQHLPISDQARELLGERGEQNGRVFPGLYYNQIRDYLRHWPRLAGITKHLTFSCLRHTYATLQLNNGTDIYTVSKMLGHRHVKTTQRYTRLLEHKKRETTHRIIIDL